MTKSLTLFEEWTDNFDRDEQERENFRTAITPSLSLAINGARTKGQVGVSITAFTYDTIDKEYRYDENIFFGGNVGVTWTPNPLWTTSLTGRVTRSDESNRTDPDDLGIRQERRTFLRYNSTLGATYQLGTVATRGSYSVAVFDDAGGEDTITHTVSAGAGTTIMQLWTPSVGYSYSHSRLSQSPDVQGHTVSASLTRIIGPFTSAGVTGSYAIFNSTRGGSDARVYRASINGSHAIPEALSIAARIGYARSVEDGNQNEDSIEAGLTLARSFARARVSLSYDQGLVATFLVGQNEGIVESRRVSASISYPFPPNVTTSLTVFHSHNEFSGRIGSTTTRADRTSEDIGGTANVAIQLLHWLSTSLDYTYQHVNDSGLGGDFVANTARLSLTGTF